MLNPTPEPPPKDPQAVLATPLAVHYGYSYSRSLENLVRDGILELNLVATGYTTLEVGVANRGLRPLHFFLFPGMIFKPKNTTTYASMVVADVREVFLYPGSSQGVRLECYSLDRKKPLPDERMPILYRLEPNPDSRYTMALRVMRALLTQDESAPDRSVEYGKHRTTIVQFALWQASAGRYNPDLDLARALGSNDPKEFKALRTLVYSEVDKLSREAAKF